MIIKRCAEDDFNNLIQFANKQFSIDFLKFQPKIYKDKYHQYLNHYLLLNEQKICGVLGSNIQEINVLGKKINVAGLGTICVDENYRGNGFMAKMINHVLDNIKDDIDIIVLSGQKNRYEPFKFYKSGEKIVFTVNKANVKYFILDNTINLTIKEYDKDNNEILYNIYSSKCVKVDRKKEVFFDTLLTHESEIFIIENQSIEGYLVYNYKKNVITEIELIDISKVNQAVSLFLSKKNLDKIDIECSLYDKQKINYLHELSERYSLVTLGNFRVINYVKVIEILLKLKSSYQNLCEGLLIIEIINKGIIEIEVKNKKIEVKMIEKVERIDYILSEKEFHQLLFNQIYSSEIDKCEEILSWFPLPLFITLFSVDSI